MNYALDTDNVEVIDLDIDEGLMLTHDDKPDEYTISAPAYKE